MKDEERIEQTKDYVGEFKINDEIVLSGTHAEIKRLYGKNKEQEKRRFNFRLLYAIIPAIVIVIFSAIFFPLYFKPEDEIRYKDITETIQSAYTSIEDYNTENGTNFLYFDESTAVVKETKKAISKEDNTFAFLKQTVIYISGEDAESIIFYASPKNVKCEEFKEFNLITQKTIYKNKTYYYTETQDLYKYIVNARFTYGNANYYLTIETGESGALTKYLDLLFKSE